MKKTGFIALVISLLCCLPAQAQFGNLINKGKNALNKAKEVKEKVDEEIKKANGDVDFYFQDAHKGFYRARNRKIVFDELHKEGKRSGKNVVYTIEKNGDITYDDGRKIGEVLKGGVVNCRNTVPYLTLTANGDVVMAGETVGHIDNNGNVTIEGKSIGKAPGIDKQVVAYIYFGIFFDKQGIDNVRAKIKEDNLRAEQERKKTEEARLKAAQEAEAKRKAEAANQAKNNQTGNKKNNSKKVSSNTTAPKVQEWPIEKDGKRGYVDANGVVYDWAHTKIGQLPPNGRGDILDGTGSRIGYISPGGTIYDSSGTELATVHASGSTSLPGSNATVIDVHASGHITWSKDYKTIGTCDARPYEWAIAIIYCNFFKL